MNYDIIIAGCGFAGATIAYLAAQDGKNVLIVEKRNHIAGNMYDYVDDAGILVQKYGPHTLHTNSEKIYRFLSSIGGWNPYILRARVMIDGQYTPSPFNFKTIDQYFPKEKGSRLKSRLLEYYPGLKSTAIVDLLECEDSSIREYARFLFEKDYRPYTAKQWGIKPEELDISVLKRVPVRLDYTDAYFDDKYQLMPEKSFTAFFEKMLESRNIEVMLNTDALDFAAFKDNGEMEWNGCPLEIPFVYTGPVDELFGLKFGRLPYRSLWFDWQTHDTDSYQETSGVAYPMAEGYTRITEYKKLPVQDVPGKTTIAVEYPADYGSPKGREPYYPVLTAESQKMYQRYLETARQINRLYLCGRLAEFKYYNMDQVIQRAMCIYEEIKREDGRWNN